MGINHDPCVSSTASNTTFTSKGKKKRGHPLPSDVIVLSDSDESENNMSMPRETVVMCYGIKLLESDLLSLLPGNWLNDQVIQ